MSDTKSQIYMRKTANNLDNITFNTDHNTLVL